MSVILAQGLTAGCPPVGAGGYIHLHTHILLYIYVYINQVRNRADRAENAGKYKKSGSKSRVTGSGWDWVSAAV